MKEESEGVKGAENQKQGMEVDKVVPGRQPSSNETDGGFMMCEVEETDETGFVTSASSKHRGSTYWCDNRCSDKALRYKQIASTVTEGGGEAHTINLCKRCCNERLVQQGKQPLQSKAWREIVEIMAHRGRLLKIFGSEQFLRGMWEYFTLKRAWTRKILADAAQEIQEGNSNTSLPSKKLWSKSKEMRRESFKEEFRKEGKLCEWTFERLQEAFDKVAMEDICRLSIAQDI